MKYRARKADEKYRAEQKQKQRARRAFTRRVRQVQRTVDVIAQDYLDDKVRGMLLAADRKFGDAISKARWAMYEASRYCPR